MNRTLRKAIAGHLWTVLPSLAELVRPPKEASAARPIETKIYDPTVGEITIRAKYHEVESADTLVVVVHGIVGDADAGYCIAAANAAIGAGCSAVRITMRGADGNGDDIYHAGMTDDLKVLLSMRCLRGYQRVILLGYSLGGNNVLHAAADHIDPRIEGLIAICPPLDFKAAAQNLDRTARLPYRKILRRRALACHSAVEKRGRAHFTARKLSQVQNSDDWYQMTIVPRFGFRNTDQFYKAAGMANHLHRIRIPVLIVSSRYDPIVPYDSVRRVLADAPSNVQAECFETGGHVYFPGDFDLGEDGALGLETQCIARVARQVRSEELISVGA